MTLSSWRQVPLPWLWGGLLLGLVFFAAVLLVKPIGVSTQFVIFDGIVWNAIDETAVLASEEAKHGHTSTNPYLAKSGGKYAKNVANPLNYGFVFVIAMMGGALVSAVLRGGVARGERTMPPVWRANFGDASWKRLLTTFAAGFLVLYGARLAGGCTSGHMMSGMIADSAVWLHIHSRGIPRCNPHGSLLVPEGSLTWIRSCSQLCSEQPLVSYLTASGQPIPTTSSGCSTLATCT